MSFRLRPEADILALIKWIGLTHQQHKPTRQGVSLVQAEQSWSNVNSHSIYFKMQS